MAFDSVKVMPNHLTTYLGSDMNPRFAASGSGGMFVAVVIRGSTAFGSGDLL